ncbi:unnamed protein product, partial [Discosporangium mesarthrocarpum]
LQVLSSKHIDCQLGYGYMLALPIEAGFSTFRRTVPLCHENFHSLGALALVGREAAKAWGHQKLLEQCVSLECNAHWWDVLTQLKIPFDCMRSQDNGSNQHQKALAPFLLQRSGGDLKLTTEFCEHYGVRKALPCVLFVEQQLGLPRSSPQDLSYQ